MNIGNYRYRFNSKQRLQMLTKFSIAIYMRERGQSMENFDVTWKALVAAEEKGRGGGKYGY